MPRNVATPDSSISQRTLSTIRCAAGSRGLSSSPDALDMSDTHERIETVVTAAEDAGARLDRVLAARIEGLSRTRLKALILDGAVTIGGRTIRDPEHRVNAADAISVAVPEADDPEPKGENIPLNIVYEDDDLVVIDKPAGLVVHPAPG